MGGPLPEGISPRLESENSKPNFLHSEHTVDLASAVMTVTACALAGGALSIAQADNALSVMASAGLFNYDVLFTDIVVNGVDVANTAGWALLPVALFLFVKQAEGGLVVDEQTDDLACLVDDVAGEHICGHASFDSADGMVCIEAYSNGKLRWVCA